MSPMSAFKIVDLWEKGRDLHPLDRALLLLGAYKPDQSYDQLANWPIGRRDSAILQLCMATFGTVFNAYIDCPKCRQRLEFTFNGQDFLFPDDSQETIIEIDHCRFRLPTTRDLAQVVNEGVSDTSALRLLKLCCLGDECLTNSENPSLISEIIETRMSEADPQANIELDFACEVCSHKWQTAFDICGFFWEEIEVRAQRLLLDVHKLACAYGWSEQQILALSERRRQVYLDLVDL